jgi:hypothetical protein
MGVIAWNILGLVTRTIHLAANLAGRDERAHDQRP